MNNEAKVRRLTKALKLGDAKVMSFEHIVMARAARAVKDAKVKGKRGRKRKSDALEADEPEPEPEPEAARAAKEVVRGKKSGRKRKVAAQEAEESEPEVAQVIDVRVPWRASVTRMI
jgi:hypothetical protein